MHHLVMADRQDVVFRPGVMQAKGHLMVVVLPMDRVLLHVAQRVIHPAHVPLEAKAKPAMVHRARHAGKGRAFFGHRHDAGHFPIGGDVHALQQGNRLVVFAPAVAIGQPLPFGPGIVAVQHRGHGIDPQPVQVIFLQPVQGIGHKEVGNLGPAIVVDQRVPVLMKALARVLMFVKCGSVELA